MLTGSEIIEFARTEPMNLDRSQIRELGLRTSAEELGAIAKRALELEPPNEGMANLAAGMCIAKLHEPNTAAGQREALVYSASHVVPAMEQMDPHLLQNMM